MPEDKLPIPQFAAKIKAKYPEYKDMNDTVLTQRILAKYPEYNDMVDMSGVNGDIKKKVGLGVIGEAAKTGGQVGTYVPQSEEKQKLADYIQGLKTKPTKEDYAGAIAKSKPLVAVDNKHPYSAEKIDTEARAKINETLYDNNDDWKDPLKNIQKRALSVNAIPTAKDLLVSDRATKLTEESLMPDGVHAKEILANTHLGNEGDDNLTAKALRNKVVDYEKTAAPFRSVDNNANFRDDFYDAAIRAFANKNPQFKKELDAVGIDISQDGFSLSAFDGDSKKGQIASRVLSDPDLITFLQKERPDLMPLFEEKRNNLIYENRDYGVNQLANEISRDMEASGYNKIDPIFNPENAAKEAGDATAKALYANDPKKLQLYEENKNEVLNSLDAPSFFEGFGTTAKDILKSTGQTFTSWFTPTSESVKDKWDKEANSVSAEPKGFTKWIRDVGGVTGLISTIGATGNITGITNPTTAGAVATYLNFWGGEMEKKKAEYPDKPVTAITLATINTSLYALLAKDIFPTAKAKSAFEAVQPEVKNVVENFTSGKISLEAARGELNTTVKKVVDFVGSTMSKTAKVSLELTGITGVNRVLDKIAGMDKEQFKELHPDDELATTLVHTFTTFAPISGLGAFGEMKRRNRVVEETIYDAVSKPLQTQRAFDRASIDLSFGTMNEIRENFNIALQTKKELDQLKVHPKDQKRFIFEALKEKAAKDQLEASGDSVIQNKAKEAISESQKIKEQILDGTLPEDLTPEQELLTKALPEISGMFRPMAEEAAKTPEGAKKFLEEAKSQINSEVRPDMGDSGNGAAKAFGKTISDHVESSQPKAEETVTTDVKPEGVGGETTIAGSGGVGGDVMKGVNDKIRQTELEMEFKGNDAELSFKNNDVEIVVAKPIGADGKYSVTVSEKSDSNTGFTLNEGKTKLFDTKLEALEYAKEQKEQSLKETTKEEPSITPIEEVKGKELGSGGVGGDVESKKVGNFTADISDAKNNIEDKVASIDANMKKYGVTNDASKSLMKRAIEKVDGISVNNVFDLAQKIAKNDNKPILIEHIAEAIQYEVGRTEAEKDAFNISLDDIKETILSQNKEYFPANKERMEEIGITEKSYIERKNKLKKIKQSYESLPDKSKTLVTQFVKRYYDGIVEDAKLSADEYLELIGGIVKGKEIEDVAENIQNAIRVVDDKEAIQLSKLPQVEKPLLNRDNTEEALKRFSSNELSEIPVFSKAKVEQMIADGLKKNKEVRLNTFFAEFYGLPEKVKTVVLNKDNSVSFLDKNDKAVKGTLSKSEFIDLAFKIGNAQHKSAYEISRLYHEAKADGSNPELTKAVEDLIGKEQSLKETTQPQQVKVEVKEDVVDKETPTNTEAQVEKVTELETKRSEEIKEATKVDVDLTEFSEIDIEKSSSKQLKRVDRVNRDFERLKEVINCIWGKAV